MPLTGRFVLALTALALAAGAGPAFAQEEPAAPDSSIEQITITSQKRETLLQETPMSVSAFTGADLEGAGIDTVEDLSYLVPNLHYGEVGDAAGGAASITIRGVSTQGGEPATSFHTDGVYQGSNAVPAALTNFDLERIEVLRGPQGTLYGRNSTGGAINYISRRPSYEFEASGDVLFGSYDRIFTRGMLNVPIIEDVLSTRISGFHERRDGYTRNVFVGVRNKDPNDERQSGLRGQIRYQPTPDMDLVVRGIYSRSVNHVGFSSKLEGDFVEFIDQTPDLPPFPIFRDAEPNPSDKREIALDTVGSVNSKVRAFTMAYDWDLLDLPWIGDATFSMVGGYQQRKTKAKSDADLSSAPILIADNDTKRKEYNVDLHFAGDAGWDLWDSQLEWLVGAFYYGSENKFDLIAPASVPAPDNLVPFIGSNLNLDVIQYEKNNSDSVAGYANASYTLLDQWTLSGGIRYNWDQKRLVDDDDPVILDLGPLGPFVAAPELDARDKEDWDRFTGTVGLDYQHDPNHLVYGKWTQGYKAGVLNSAVVIFDESTRMNVNQDLANAPPERIRAYEVGSKNTFWDGKFQANITGFYYDYSNLQVSQLINSNVVTQTAAEAEIWGVELEFTLLPIDGLLLKANLAYLDTEFKDFDACFFPEDPAPDPPISGDFRNVDCSGNSMIRAPEYSVTLIAQYDWDMGRFGHLIPYAQFYGSDDVFFRAQSENQIRDFNEAAGRSNSSGKQDNYTLFNLRLTWRSAEDHFWAEGFINNVFDKDVTTTKTIGSALLGSPNQTSFDAPRRAGVRVGVKW